MAEIKTKKNDQSVEEFLNRVSDEARRQDCFTVLSMMKAVTKVEPKMWGAAIVGFGTYQYKYASGQEGEWPIIGFSPRKQDLTLYLMSGFEKSPDLMKKLGKHKTGKSCLYIKKIEDIDLKILKKLIEQSVKSMSKKRTS